MRNKLFRKSLILGIIFLLVGITIPGNASDVIERRQTPNTMQDDGHHNYIGEMFAWWDSWWIFPDTNIEIPPEEERHYFFSLNEDGTITANFSYNCSSWTIKTLILERISSFDVTIFDGPDISDEPLVYNQIKISVQEGGPAINITARLDNISIDMDDLENRTLSVRFEIRTYWFWVIPMPLHIRDFFRDILGLPQMPREAIFHIFVHAIE